MCEFMKENRFVGFYNPSVILTYIGVTFAFVSMYLAWSATEQTDFRWSIFFLMLAGLCDMFDGTVARRVKRKIRHTARLFKRYRLLRRNAGDNRFYVVSRG